MARSAADCAAILQVIAGWDAHDPTSIDTPVPEYSSEVGKSIRDMRIGIDRSYSFDGTDLQIATALEKAIAVLEGLGARIVEVTNAGLRRTGRGMEHDVRHRNGSRSPRYLSRTRGMNIYNTFN